ncbi:MAG TPA: hypothetical protein VFB16_00060, partial [Bauldia sp.]|nr:hypothetical protein [Bauldia sp.]
TLIAVVLGADTSTGRAELAARLLNQGFNGFFPGFTPAGLAGFRSAAARGTAPNYHDDVCKRRKLLEEDDSADIGDSALGPPVPTMAPVVVRTGLADSSTTPAAPGTVPATGTPKATGIPLPRLRPPYRAGADKAPPSFDQRFDPGHDRLSLR